MSIERAKRPTSSAPNDPPDQALPSVDGALAWRSLEGGLREAKALARPILLLCEPPWSNSAQRLAYVLQRSPNLVDLIESSFVPILVDPLERPEVNDAVCLATATLAGSIGPPLLALLTHEGQPFLPYTSMRYEGDGDHPSLESVLRATHDMYTDDPQRFLREATDLRNKLQGGDVQDRLPTTAAQLRSSLLGQADHQLGGFPQTPKHPLPTTLWFLLDEYLQSGDEDSRLFLATTLEAMMRGGIRDQLWRGFHRCSRDERWIVPHFEKIVPTNAALAALYAKAGRHFERLELRDVALETASFALTALEAEVVAVASDTYHYTWLPYEVQRAVDRATLQTLGFHYHLTSSKERHVLYQAVKLEELPRYTYLDAETVAEQVRVGREQMLMYRQRRRHPTTVRDPGVGWTAETLFWLWTASEFVELPTDQLDERTAGICERAEKVLSQALDVNAIGYVGDLAALGCALIKGNSHTGSQLWAQRATELADAIVEHFVQPDGCLMLVKQKPSPSPMHTSCDGIVDHFVRSPVGNTLCLLKAIPGNDVYRQVAKKISAAYRATAMRHQALAGSYWHAGFM